jgi:hypothetical protein
MLTRGRCFQSISSDGQSRLMKPPGSGNRKARVAGKLEIRVRSLEKHSQEGPVEPQISPLRCASVEMTKGRAVPPATVVAEQAVFHHLGWAESP